LVPLRVPEAAISMLFQAFDEQPWIRSSRDAPRSRGSKIGNDGGKTELGGFLLASAIQYLKGSVLPISSRYPTARDRAETRGTRCALARRALHPSWLLRHFSWLSELTVD